ncbi:MAG: VTT domain-containing protein [Nitrospirota bacterium]
MKLSRLYIAVIAVLVAAVLAAWFLWLHDVVSFQNIKAHRHELREMVGEHYVSSVAAFVGAVLCTAFFMPGALALALLGGFLFGTVHCIVYVNAGGLMGATLAFLLARHLLGNWLQQHYEHELRAFNREIKRHGHNYLVTLRILPIFPFFLVNLQLRRPGTGQLELSLGGPVAEDTGGTGPDGPFRPPARGGQYHQALPAAAQGAGELTTPFAARYVLLR